MNNGSVNLFTSRRINFLECEYWLVSKNDISKDRTKLTYENVPEGQFTAKIENSVENRSTVVAQTFLFDTSSLAISTTDSVPGLKRNCLVSIKQFEGTWRVESIDQYPIRINYQFDNEITYRTVIQLRR